MRMEKKKEKVRFDSVIWFNGISILDGYLMPNPGALGNVPNSEIHSDPEWL